MAGKSKSGLGSCLVLETGVGDCQDVGQHLKLAWEKFEIALADLCPYIAALRDL